MGLKFRVLGGLGLPSRLHGGRLSVPTDSWLGYCPHPVEFFLVVILVAAIFVIISNCCRVGAVSTNLERVRLFGFSLLELGLACCEILADPWRLLSRRFCCLSKREEKDVSRHMRGSRGLGFRGLGFRVSVHMRNKKCALLFLACLPEDYSKLSA